MSDSPKEERIITERQLEAMGRFVEQVLADLPTMLPIWQQRHREMMERVARGGVSAPIQRGADGDTEIQG